jgi:hypothetical protein
VMLLQAAMQVCETSSLFRYLLHQNPSLQFFTKSQLSVHVCTCCSFTPPTSLLLYQAISQPAKSSTLQHVPHIHNIQAKTCLRLSKERCCHFVPCPDKVYHRTSHSEKNYHFKTMMSLPPCMSHTLYITHNLDRRVKCIWSLPHCI